MRFPWLATTPLPIESNAMVDELSALVKGQNWAEGYLRLRGPAGDDRFLFVHAGKAHFAGAIDSAPESFATSSARAEDARFVSCSFLDFFESVPLARSAEYCSTDQPMLLSIAVPFRKAPSAQLPSGSVTRESLVAAIEASMKASGGRDAVIAFRRADAVSLALIRGNSPGWLFPAAGERFPESGAPAERIVGYVTAVPDVAADVYDEVVLPASEGAGKPFRTYLDEAVARALIPTGLVPSLAVYMGARVVYRYVMDRDVIRIGRGGENDLALDNLTVSRKHAVVVREGDALHFEDTGSENGLVVAGKRVKDVLLKPGERVEIGKYVIVYDHYAPKAQAAQNPVTPRKRAVEETLGVVAESFKRGVFVCNGERVKMQGMVFHIGKGDDAHLKIGGMFVAPVHVRVTRDTSGAFRATHTGGGRAMTVNGKTETDVLLKHGDQIEVAGTTITFELEAPSTKIGPRT